MLTSGESTLYSGRVLGRFDVVAPRWDLMVPEDYWNQDGILDVLHEIIYYYRYNVQNQYGNTTLLYNTNWPK